jgi:predicted anti-sigma-YlaC factor YlaD
MATKSVAGSLSSGTGEVFASDDDPELVRDATPFALKTMEALLVELPENEGLLLATCRGFTQYAYAFVQLDADKAELVDYAEAERLRDRAMRLYLRARGYGMRGLELRHSGLGDSLVANPAAALASMAPEDVPLLFWTGAAWGAATSLGRDRPDLVADLPAVVAMIKRANELDDTYDRGAIHGVLISLESLPANMGGDIERARHHFDRAVELSEGKSAGPFVTLAESVCIREQNREEFELMLTKALNIDADEEPSIRLQNLLAQDRARFLRDNADDFFLDDTGFGGEGGDQP